MCAMHSLFDKACIDFKHLFALDGRGIFWVTRAKDNMSDTVIDEFPAEAEHGMVHDQLIVLNTQKSQDAYPIRKFC